MDAHDEVKRVIALPDGPRDEGLAFGVAYSQQYGQPLSRAERVDELALAYEAGFRAALDA